MTPPTPPDGYELTDDEPREGDFAWCLDCWNPLEENGDVWLSFMQRYCVVDAKDLRWIARKITVMHTAGIVTANVYEEIK